MNAIEKENLVKEAKMQIKALKKIDIWKKTALALSTLGVTVSYAGLAGTSPRLFLGIPGIFLAVVGIIIAAILNMGLKNGRRNVEKIINAIGESRLL